MYFYKICITTDGQTWRGWSVLNLKFRNLKTVKKLTQSGRLDAVGFFWTVVSSTDVLISGARSLKPETSQKKKKTQWVTFDSVKTRPRLTQCYRWDTCRCWKNRRSQSSASTVGRPLKAPPNGRFDGWREQTAIFSTEFSRRTRCRCVQSPCAGPLLAPSWRCCSTRWRLFRCCEGRTVCPTEWLHRRSTFCQHFCNNIF